MIEKMKPYFKKNLNAGQKRFMEQIENACIDNTIMMKTFTQNCHPEKHNKIPQQFIANNFMKRLHGNMTQNSIAESSFEINDMQELISDIILANAANIAVWASSQKPENTPRTAAIIERLDKSIGHGIRKLGSSIQMMETNTVSIILKPCQETPQTPFGFQVTTAYPNLQRGNCHPMPQNPAPYLKHSPAYQRLDKSEQMRLMAMCANPDPSLDIRAVPGKQAIRIGRRRGDLCHCLEVNMKDQRIGVYTLNQYGDKVRFTESGFLPKDWLEKHRCPEHARQLHVKSMHALPGQALEKTFSIGPNALGKILRAAKDTDSTYIPPSPPPEQENRGQPEYGKTGPEF